jgi:enoyl-CoA hydratase
MSIASDVRHRTHASESKNTSFAQVGQWMRRTPAVWPGRTGSAPSPVGQNRPMSADQPVRVTDEGPVRIVTIDRPQRRNAVDAATARLLLTAFEAFDADDAASVAVLTGSGGFFCAGADLKALTEGDRRPVGESGPGPMGPTRLRLGKPVIAAIEGPAVAGGLELALWCDLRVAAADATLGVYCRRFGVPLIDLGTIRLPRLIGHSRAIDLILTGRGVDGTEAERIGLVNRVVAPGQALAVAVELAGELAALPQRCMRNDRLSALEQWGLSEDEAMRNEVVRGRATIESGETLDGAARFAAGAGRNGGRAPA